jgi:hypothetical protein
MFAAILLAVTIVVHASTFLSIDPMERWPGVMFLHLAVFPPFIAAIYYASRACGGSKNVDPAVNSSPQWLRRLTIGLFAYAFVNFALFLFLNEGGSPQEREGKYLVTRHGKIVRELTEDEYHRHRAYVVRGFSGHWMFFFSASLTLLVGAASLKRRAAGMPRPQTTPPENAYRPFEAHPN